MPHLSPLSWLILPFFIWFAVTLLMISLWFTPNPTPTYRGMERSYKINSLVWSW